MAWNWQHRNWPQFIYDIKDFKEYELKFFENAGMLYGSLQHVDENEQQALKVDLMSDEAYKTSEIEGELLNRDSNKGKTNHLPALIRSAVAHLYFECIHPFEDGNGRIGRAISEKSLSQSLGKPTLVALSHAILDQKKSYYEALEKNNRDFGYIRLDSLFL